MNTDQGSQFTSHAFTELIKAQGIRLSMDRRGAWRDHIFVERLWRSVKYEEVYLQAYDSVAAARRGGNGIFSFTIVVDRIPVLRGRRPMIGVFMTSHSLERPNSNRSDPLSEGHPVVQRNGATSLFTRSDLRLLVWLSSVRRFKPRWRTERMIIYLSPSVR